MTSQRDTYLLEPLKVYVSLHEVRKALDLFNLSGPIVGQVMHVS